MSKLKVNNSIKKYYLSLNPRERRLFVVMVILVACMAVWRLAPSLGEVGNIFVEQKTRLKEATNAIGISQKIVNKYLQLKSKQRQIEKKFEKNEFKEGHLSYVDSLKSPDIVEFSIGAQQEKEFGKDFNQVTFKINFKASSLATVMNFIKKLENEKRKYLISELSIKKAYGYLVVVIEVNSIERKK